MRVGGPLSSLGVTEHFFFLLRTPLLPANTPKAHPSSLNRHPVGEKAAWEEGAVEVGRFSAPPFWMSQRLCSSLVNLAPQDYVPVSQ